MGWFKKLFESEEETEEVEENIEGDSKNYVVRAICKNCKNKSKLLIPKGKVGREFIKSLNCSKCNLKQFKMMTNQIEEDWGGDFFDTFDFEDYGFDEDNKESIEKGKVELKLRVNEEDFKEISEFITKLHASQNRRSTRLK